MSTSRHDAVVMGLGLFGGGVAMTRLLCREGYRVLVTDTRDRATLQSSIDALRDFDVDFRLGEHREDDFRNVRLVVKNQAVRAEHPLLDIARASAAVITSEMNLFMERCRGRVIGITGSNGKTTVTTMLYAMLCREHPPAQQDVFAETLGGAASNTRSAKEEAGARVWLGGNLGRPLVEHAHEIGERDLVVLELSSFQLMDLDEHKRSPALGIVTNITPNHLDWHPTMAEYVRAKAAIFRHSGPDAAVVLNADDPIVKRLAESAPGRVIMCKDAQRAQDSTTGVSVDAWLDEKGAGFMREDAGAVQLFTNGDVRLPGRHSRVNALMAAAAARLVGIAPASIAAALQDFRGVPHRIEFVAELKGVRYYNDSIATTPESAIAAIHSFSEPIHLLLGGSDKKLAYDELAETIATAPNVRRIYLTGDAGAAIGDTLERACRRFANPLRDLVIEREASFAAIVRRAHQVARKGSIFLMSPACASFYEFEPGQRFRNFEHRGEHFKKLVRELESGAKA